ncbi:LuxR C-terminal-related transcriptional regulator [Streptomyces sp.]|uniref:LuxR C-terminal-related transcriptional regulator n=1 Tax=Streptomyces sp. TaxID=1931 RepID=UPI0028112971|nr:LuxR C-terminal-related transcriptional regulator [Streptomyces sp.]
MEKDFGLTTREAAAYRDIAEGRPVHPDLVARLTDLGLLGHVGSELVPLDPRVAAQRLLAAHRATLEQALREVSYLPALEALSQHYAPSQFYGGPASKLLQSKEAMNAEIGMALDETTRELLTAQPGQPEDRDPEVQREGIERARRLLERGVAVRSIYTAAALEHEPTVEYVDLILEGGAEVRVAHDLPPRMVLTGSTLFIDNVVVADEDPNAGWCVTDIAAVSFARTVYEAYWARAVPWETARAALRDAVTSTRQRYILRGLAKGGTQATIAAQLEVSEREVRRDLEDLRARLALPSTNALLYWWATAPDHGIP